MSETKHTPGPWKIWERASEFDPSFKITAKDYIVAQTIGNNDEANARLIAAAPDLLAMCKKLIIPAGCYNDTLHHELLRVITKAKQG